jgi:hypothetical protein
MNDKQDTDDVPPIATRVTTLPEAVQLSIKDGLTENCLFVFARLLKAFEITTGSKLKSADLESAFSLWWNKAKSSSLLPADADFDEYRFDFEDRFGKVKTPHGANPLDEAIRRADTKPLPPQADRYHSPKIKKLVAVCYHLQILAGDDPFFLSVRDAARILGTKNLHLANAMLAGLVRDGVLRVVEKEKRAEKKARRFRFNFASSGEP